jgi:hypothetical protein
MQTVLVLPCVMLLPDLLPLLVLRRLTQRFQSQPEVQWTGKQEVVAG